MNRKLAAAASLMMALALAGSSVQATDNDKVLSSVTASFGAGLNTAQPGNAVNHHILPHEILVKQGGVVNFVVAGLHQIMVYNPGKRPEHVMVPATGFFINDTNNLFYQGIAPAGGPLALPATVDPSNAVNRVESVSFPSPGTYLVICNVRPHFLDGMFAFVKVIP